MSMEVKHLYVTFPTINRSNVERFLVVRLHFAKHTKYAHTKYASKHAKGLSQKDTPKWLRKGKLVKSKKKPG